MQVEAITVMWFKRDLRLSDNAALTAAAKRGPVVPVFIYDEVFATLGAAAKLRLEMSLVQLRDQLEIKGLQLILRRGDALAQLQSIVSETGADAVFWSRAYDPASVARDKNIKAQLIDQDITATSFTGALLFEPWSVETGQGGPYRVYTPFWKAVRGRDVAPLTAPPELRPVAQEPESDQLADWKLSHDMAQGGPIVAAHVKAGEIAARDRLAEFIKTSIHAYKAQRDFLGEAATSELSDALTFGEISPKQCWHTAQRALQDGASGAEHYLKELVWREFAWHLLWHYPDLDHRNWRPEWESFHWIEDENDPKFVAWCRGQTGEPVVDAAMRELYVTGKMHNRARMIAASYLTKHLRMHWRLGLKWFADCLVDWDPASNAMGWQWVAGSGPDASPYFRVFNPATQAEKFDADGRYQDRWIAEKSLDSCADSKSFYDAMPKSWGLKSNQPYPSKIVDLKQGRLAALAAYEQFKAQ